MARSDGPPATRRIAAATPDQGEPRTYIEITPAEASPTPADVRRGFERLYQHLQPDRNTNLFGRITGRSSPTTLEWLLVSDGGEARPIRYLVGCTDDDPSSLDGLESTLRSVFPAAYEFDRVECHPGALLSTNSAGTRANETPNATTPTDRPYVTGVEFTGDYEHPLDWQTRLTPYGGVTPAADTDTTRPEYRRGQRSSPQSNTPDSPIETTLSGLVETLATAEFPMLYQVLLRPKADWTADLLERKRRIRHAEDNIVDILLKPIFESGSDPVDPEDRRLSDINERRLEELDAKNPRKSFEVTARAAIVAPPSYWDDPRSAHAAARELASSLTPLGRTTTDVTGRIRRDDRFHAGTLPPGRRVLEAIVDRELADSPPTENWHGFLPGDDAQALVADVAEAPGFCILDGDALPATAQRAVAPRHSERTAIVPPPPATLDYFRGEGMYLGHVKDQDGTPEHDRLVLPPSEQTTHSLVLGKSGSGKSVLGQTAMTANHGATDGASIVIDRKGDGFVDAFLRTHYATYGDLEDVLYFDASDVVPAFSMLDVRPDVAAGRSRRAAVEDRASYFAEILTMLMTGDQYEAAKVSPHVIEFLVKAALDPVHGDDVVAFDEFKAILDRLHHDRETPPTVYEGVASGLANIAANASTSYEDVMQGAATRMFDIQQHVQLYRLFNHAPEDRDDEATPLFAFDDLLDEDVVIVFDISGLRDAGQRAFTGLVFAQLWAALKRRAAREGRAVEPSDLGFDDAGLDPDAVPKTDVDGPEPTAPAEPSTDGGVDTRDSAGSDAGSDAKSASGDRPLVNLYVEEAADVAATDMVGEFLQQARGFDCGVTLSMQFPAQVEHAAPAAYDELLNDVSTIVTGNVGDDRRLARRFATDAMPPEAVANRLRALRKGEWLVSLPAPWGEAHTRPFLMESAPLQPGHPEGPEPLTGAHETLYKAELERCRSRTTEQYGLRVHGPTPQTPTEQTPDDSTGNELDVESTGTLQQLQSALPHTNRLPDVVEYDETAHALVCAGCDSRYATTAADMERAITCCNSLDVVDHDDIPICEVPLTLSAEECAESEYSVKQLCFLQAVFTAHLGRYDTDLEYDIRRDSMLRLQEYLDVDSEAIEELIDDGLLNHDGDRPHRLYTVTNDGLDLIQEQRREGITHGDGIGDLGESSLHRVMVLDGAELLQQDLVDDPESPAVEVRTYYETDGYRYDAVALDADGDIVAAIEAERANHDLLEAAPEDYDKLAAAAPEAAVWIVENRDAAHKVLRALNEPNDKTQRVGKTYSETTAPQRFTIDEPGLTDIHTIGYLRNTLLDE